ncbi:MAG: 5'-methylthioadenosine/adenosylhomocysteine nucleosidase [Lachnospiraceae bacterium]|nr:5'-methylthioadenosine/adenosylhomocysteine nucleosidase [Lachnospiraceae bacterium]
MARIGVIGAMDEEVASLIKQMEGADKMQRAGMTFYHGVLWKQDAVVVKSGVGKVNMAACTQIMVDEYQVDFLINTGVAGGLYKDIKVGDIVISSDAIQHDFDVSGLGYEKSVIPDLETSVFKADPKLVKMAKEACELVNPEIQCFVGRVVSGDQFISANDVKKHLVEDFHGYCAEMEGGAMAQVATLNKIPFVVIRAMSDNADSSANVSYREFEEQAIVHTVKLLAAMFLKMGENK